VLEGSEDGDRLIPLDKKDGKQQLDDRYVMATFTCQKTQRVRFRQTGKNPYDNDRLIIGPRAIFGTLSQNMRM
jgi:hypothetical protein